MGQGWWWWTLSEERLMLPFCDCHYVVVCRRAKEEEVRMDGQRWAWCDGLSFYSVEYLWELDR